MKIINQKDIIASLGNSKAAKKKKFTLHILFYRDSETAPWNLFNFKSASVQTLLSKFKALRGSKFVFIAEIEVAKDIEPKK